jgi:ABC-2 type transport system ATP-binding protein
MAPILEVNHLFKKYGDFTAVDDVSFQIERGEIFSLLGPNGAGKTTTISMLSTLLQPTAGDATIGGHSITKDSIAVRKIIGVVPQEIALYDALTARENLIFWGRMYGLNGADLNHRADAGLEQVGLSDRARSRVQTFSGGMKRRLNIAVGLLHQPQILFMDEPTVGYRSAEPPQHFRRSQRAQPAGPDRALHYPLYGRSSGALSPGWHHRPR